MFTQEEIDRESGDMRAMMVELNQITQPNSADRAQLVMTRLREANRRKHEDLANLNAVACGVQILVWSVLVAWVALAPEAFPIGLTLAAVLAVVPTLAISAIFNAAVRYLGITCFGWFEGRVNKVALD